MDRNDGKPFIKIGKDQYMTRDEINEFMGRSDSSSEDSDWDDLKEANVDEFLVNKDVDGDKGVKSKKVFEKSKSPLKKKPKVPAILPGTITPRRQEVAETKETSDSSNKNDSKYLIAVPTRVRVSNPQISSDSWKERSTGRQVLPVSKAVVKKTKTDAKYTIWHLNDLQTVEKAVKVFLFRDVYETHWKESVGTVVAILQPKLLPSNKEFKDKAFTVDNPLQIMILGLSPDLGVCQGKSKLGDSCRNIVNKSQCSLCAYHVQQGYFKATSRPGFSNLGIERLNERKRKAAVLPWAAANPAEKKPKNGGVVVNNNTRPQMTLDKLEKGGIIKMATSWGLLENIPPQDGSAVPPHNGAGSISHGAASTSLTKVESKFLEMLKKPTAGSLSLVKHIVEKSKGNTVSIASAVARRSRIFDNSQPTAAPDLTFDEIRRRLQPAAPQRDDPQRYINLGLKPVCLDGASREVYAAELNRLRLTAAAQSKGGYAAMRDSNRLDRLKNIGKAAETSSAKIATSKPAVTPELLKLLGQGSANKKLVDIEKGIELDEKLDRMEKIEQMETKLSSIQEQDCVFFICNECKTKTPMKPRMCVAEGHTVRAVKGLKRFFQCIKCKTRTTTFDKYPAECCLKCGSIAFEKTGKMKEREVAEEKLLVHGDARRFISN